MKGIIRSSAFDPATEAGTGEAPDESGEQDPPTENIPREERESDPAPVTETEETRKSPTGVRISCGLALFGAGFAARVAIGCTVRNKRKD